MKSLADECERKCKDISEELAAELSHLAFDNNAYVSIQLDSTTEWGKRGSLFLGGVGGFILSTGLRAALGPIGWGLTAVGILGNLFFDSEKKQRAQNRQKLRDAITSPSYDVLGKMHDKVIETFNQKILAEGVDGIYDSLADRQFMLARLGNSQYNMASALFSEFSDLNFKLLVEASNYKNVGSAKNIYDIPRIPGETMIILADSSNLDTKKLSDLLGEKVSVVKPEENFPDTLKKVLGSDYDVDYYPLDFTEENKEPEEAIAIFPKKKVDVTKFKLAQQIAGVPIILKFNQPQRVTQPQQVNQSTRRNNQSNTTSSSGRTQSNDFSADFRIVDKMFDDNVHSRIIKDKLSEIEIKANNQRNADAMKKLSNYWRAVGQDEQAAKCFNRAKTFTSATNSSNSHAIPSGGRKQQNNAFKSDFAKIDEMLSRPRKSNEGIKKALQKLEAKIIKQRDAVAINRVAVYYGRIHEHQAADRCYELAKTFAR